MKRLKEVVLVESDYLTRDWIEKQLKRYFPGVNIAVFTTEEQLVSALAGKTLRFMPDAVITEIILAWTEPSLDIVLPSDEVKTQGRTRAGYRLQKLVQEHLPLTPVIFYTTLHEQLVKEDLVPWPIVRFMWKRMVILQIW